MVIQEVLGVGNFGEVYKGVWQVSLRGAKSNGQVSYSCGVKKNVGQKWEF